MNPKPRPHVSRLPTNGTQLLLLCALASGVTLALVEATRAASVSFDAARYLELAAAYEQHGIHGCLDWYSGPLFPVLVGSLYSVIGSLEWAGRLTGLAFAGILVVAIRGIAAELFGRRTGDVAAALTALHPALIRHSVTAELDVPYLALLACALFWALTSIRSPRASQKTARALAAGLFFGLAYLVRPEGLIVCLLLCGGLVAVQFHRSRPGRLPCVIIAAVAVAVSLPYLHWLHGTLGRWTLSGKDRTLALKYLPDKRHPQRALQAGAIGAILQNPDDLIDWLPVHARRTATELPKAVGYALLPLLVVGAVRLWRTAACRRSPVIGPFLLACLFPVVAFALLYPYERYFLQVLPVALPLAALGLVAISSRLARKHAHARTALLGVVLLLNLTHAVVQAREPLEASRQYKREIGERIARELGPGKRILAFTIEAFYARGERVKRWDPFEGIVPGHGFGQPFTYESMLEFVRRHGVEVIVVDHHFRKDCPEFMSRVRPEHFELVFTVRHNEEPIYVFRTNPRLLEESPSAP